MLYAWGAWLIFFCLCEKISEYIEDPTLKGHAMNATLKKYLPNLIGFAVCGTGWLYCHIREQQVRRELDKSWTAIYENDQEYFDKFYRPENEK